MNFLEALEKMKYGQIVYKGTLNPKYRLSQDGQHRVDWTFAPDTDDCKWESANIFLSDIEYQNWEIWDNKQTLERAIRRCHVRDFVYRKSNPDVKYAKNHPNSFEDRIPYHDQIEEDWCVYDPRDEECTYPNI